MAKQQQLSLDEFLEQALVKNEDKPYEVPENWVWTKLNILYNFIDYRGKTPKKTEYGIPLVTAKNVKQGYIDYSISEFISREEYLDRQTRGISQKGDILITTEAPLGNVALADLDEFSAGQRLITLQKYPSISDLCNPFYEFYILSDYFQNDINNRKTGTTVAGIKAEKLKLVPIPLPPLPEQQRIVVLIESLFEKLDRAKELAQNALDSFENRKSAILHKAFTGELTRKWREENGVDCGDDIVGKLYNYRIGLAKTSAGRDKVETIFKYQEHQDNERLPESWRYVALEKLCESFQYGTSRKSDYQGEVVVLRMGNLQSGKIDWSNLAYTSDEEDILKYSLRNGDVLFNRTNSPELVGKTSIYASEQPAIFAGYLIRIKNFKYLNSYYLNYAMNTLFAKDYCMRVKSDGVNQSNINAQKLAKFEIPFCSLKEQREIVRILDNLLENEQKAKELCDVLGKIDHMKKAILARAFRGELGTNIPDEESALELLKEMLKKKV